MKIAIISGGHRSEGNTQHVAAYLKKTMASKGHEVTLIDADSMELPLFTQRLDRQPALLAKHQKAWDACKAAEAYIFASPEYNGGYAATFKNYIDHLDPVMFRRKAIGICTVSDGAMAGGRAAQQLQLQSLALFGVPLANMLMVGNVTKKFSPTGELIDPAFATTVDGMLDHFYWLAQTLTSGR